MRRLLGTFHKTGTVLWGRILRAAEKKGLLKTWRMHEGTMPDSYDLAFDMYSTRLFTMLEADPCNARAVFCVRDPRDVIVSAAYYHQVSDEPWLHVSRKDFGGLTYQQKINSLSDMQARFQFELEHASRPVIQNMLKIPFSSPNVFVTRLERLVVDDKLEEFGRIFEFLGLDDPKVRQLKIIARSKSLFSGKIANSTHVRSGKPAQYLSEFSEETLEMFDAAFDSAVESLGYQK